jgi:hypothetical protein
MDESRCYDEDSLAVVSMSGQQTHGLPRRDNLPESVVRAELAQILASDVFSRSDRLSAFLKFVVEQTPDGHGDALKEQVLANELYGRGTDFSTAADPIVRVDARRLRDKLREYYASSPRDPVVISVPKGSYTPVFELTGNGATPGVAGAIEGHRERAPRIRRDPQRVAGVRRF